MTANELPILYSFRRCPYAIRARMALHAAEIELEHREIILKNKPPSMLEASPKGTVPVLVLEDGTVMDESLDVILWALEKNDPLNWLGKDHCHMEASLSLIEMNDGQFKHYLDRYKYADRYPERSQEHYREQSEFFLGLLDERLRGQSRLLGDRTSLADIAILPFIRQFAFVDKTWFDHSPYKHLSIWLEALLHWPLFETVMEKRPLWPF